MNKPTHNEIMKENMRKRRLNKKKQDQDDIINNKFIEMNINNRKQELDDLYDNKIKQQINFYYHNDKEIHKKKLKLLNQQFIMRTYLPRHIYDTKYLMTDIRDL